MLDRTKHPTLRGESILLGDGTSCRIRPIGADDRMFLADCFSGLSPESRRLRFFSAKPVLTERDLAFLTSVDGRDHIALGAVRLSDAGEEIEALGVARCIRAESGAKDAEFAIAVVDAAQGRGIGKALLTQLVETARRQGIEEFHYEVLADNKRMRALARNLTTQVRALDGSTLEYRYLLPAGATRTSGPAVADLLDPVVVARQWRDAWSGGVEHLVDSSFAFCRLLIGIWFGAGGGTAGAGDAPAGTDLPLALAD